MKQECSERLTSSVLEFAEGIGIIKTFNLLGEKSKEVNKSFEKSCEESINFEIAYAPWWASLMIAYGDKDTLKNICFEAKRGEMIALVGPSGGGKSTIANFIARFWDVKSGSIAIRGTDIRKVPVANLMDNISMVFQRVYLFQDTIYNNIAMGKTNATREEVIEVAK